MKEGNKLLRILLTRQIWEREPDKYLQYDSDEEVQLVKNSCCRKLKDLNALKQQECTDVYARENGFRKIQLVEFDRIF